MKDKRKKDRRKSAVKTTADKRKGPRRLVCCCGGKIDVVICEKTGDKFVCVRCGKKQ